jgi:hypothetical protein
MSGPVDVLAVLKRIRQRALPNLSEAEYDEIVDATAAVADLIKALRIAVLQNSHDMLMTGEELRICESALARVGGAS